jgi:hypothetical protein
MPRKLRVEYPSAMYQVPTLGCTNSWRHRHAQTRAKANCAYDTNKPCYGLTPFPILLLRQFRRFTTTPEVLFKR